MADPNDPTRDAPHRQRLEIPEGPARRALAHLRTSLDRALSDLDHQAAALRAEAAGQAVLVLAGMGHDVSRAAGLTIEQDGSSVTLVTARASVATGGSQEATPPGLGPSAQGAPPPPEACLHPQ